LFYNNIPEPEEPSPEDISKRKEKKYKFWYKRFAHLGPAKIKILYKITILAKPIKVPGDKYIYDVYIRTKMRNSTKKKLSL
jgi:hypothetical protein